MVSGVVVWRSVVSRLSCQGGWEGLLGDEDDVKNMMVVGFGGGNGR